MKKAYIILTIFFSILLQPSIQAQPPIIIESPGFYIGELTLQEWGTDWTNSNVYRYAYDGQGRKTGTAFFSWISNQWVKTDTLVQSYNTDNTLNTMTNQRWDGNSWNNYARYQYTYDTEGKELTEEITSWDGATWNDSLRNTTSYDLDGYLSLYLEEEWNGTVWEDKRKKSYTVNPDGTIAQKLEEYWGAGWTFSTRTSYTYSDGKIIEEQREWHNGISWGLDTKFIYTYENENLISSLTQHWNSNITAWVDERKFTHTYNPDGSISHSVNQEWTSAHWNNLAKFSYTYQQLTEYKDPEPSTNLQIIPNPFTENIQLDFSEENIPADVKLYNQQGKMVKQFVLNSSEETIYVGDLIKGSYYASISLENNIVYKKLIKIE